MAERKVLNKYFPPDFDPSKIPRQKKPKNLNYKVRLMAPFSMRCTGCGNYIYKATKFNANKEDAEGEMYLGIQIFRFYIRCPRCHQEITFKTDPQNSDYVAETGCTRNFDVWKHNSELEAEEAKKKEAEEMGDAMKVLENRTKASKRDMDILDALEEIREGNLKNAKVNVDEILQHNLKAAEEEEMLSKMTEEEQDAKAIREAFGEGPVIKRIQDSDSENEEDDAATKKLKKKEKALREESHKRATEKMADLAQIDPKRQAKDFSSLVKTKGQAPKKKDKISSLIVRKPKSNPTLDSTKISESTPPTSGLALGLGDYGSSSDSDDDE